MKRMLILACAIAMLVAGSGVFAMTTRAAEETKMSPEHIERINGVVIQPQFFEPLEAPTTLQALDLV